MPVSPLGRSRGWLRVFVSTFFRLVVRRIIQRNLVHLPRDQLLRTTLHRRIFSDILCWSSLSFWDLNQSSKMSVSAFSITKWCNFQVLWMQVAAKFFFSDKCSTKKRKTEGTKWKSHRKLKPWRVLLNLPTFEIFLKNFKSLNFTYYA